MVTEVMLSGETIKLQVPGSLAMRWDIAGASLDAPRRAMWASLAVCWRSLNPPKAKLAKHRHDVASFGAAVMDEMLARGHGFVELNEASLAAFQLTVNGLVTDDEVITAVGFTEAPAEEQPG
mgnify:CR=1 FL=1